MSNTEWPIFTAEQLEFLERYYPPRCKEPTESLEDHAHYAGKVKLIGLMRYWSTAAREDLEGEEAELEAALRDPDN